MLLYYLNFALHIFNCLFDQCPSFTMLLVFSSTSGLTICVQYTIVHGTLTMFSLVLGLTCFIKLTWSIYKSYTVVHRELYWLQCGEEIL